MCTLPLAPIMLSGIEMAPGRGSGVVPRAHGASRRARAGAFTIIELIMGLVVLSFILLAVAGLVMAVGDSWNASKDSQALDSGRAMVRVNAMLRSARYVGLATSDGDLAGETPETVPGGAVMFWRGDDNDDNIMQVKEVVLLERDPATSELKIYEYTGTDAASNTPYSEPDVADAMDRDQFKALPAVRGRVLAKYVGQVKFKASAPGDAAKRQSVEMQLKFKKGKEARSEFATATLRSPKRPETVVTP